MILILDFDQDSGISNLKGEWMTSSIYGWYILLVPEEDKNQFIEAWYERKLGITDRVYETLLPVFERVVYCLMNNIN